MNPFRCLTNFSGQALVETLFALPILVAGVTLVLGGLHSLSAFYLTDYWSYQMAQCLNQEVPSPKCKQTFAERVETIPVADVQLIVSQNLKYQSKVVVKLYTPLIHGKKIENKISKNLTSQSFRRP